ncbi:MAG: hypothetical protein A4E72_01944 [Syntrophus sp. PtaU1.Bin208]|nr:MAG: hypothetical protein A4E72_01944 [Syntrophus sp. PtaU1.Bin208]
MNIHILEPLNNFVKLQDGGWESGWWSIDENKAKELVGGEIYFHKKQQEPSFFGGIIGAYRIEEDGQHQGNIVFIFQYHAECRNVRTDKNGWSKKMKIINGE